MTTSGRRCTSRASLSWESITGGSGGRTEKGDQEGALWWPRKAMLSPDPGWDMD